MSSIQSMNSVVTALCNDVNTPRALTVFLLYKHGEWEQLLSLKVAPAHYLDPESLAKDVSVTELLRKIEIDIPGKDLEREARDLFFRLEAVNERSNIRLSRFNEGGPFYGPSDLRVAEVFSVARKKASDILGSIPDFLCPRFGPGATFSDRGRLTTIPDKIASRPSITSSSRDFLHFWSESAWGRSVIADRRDSDPEVVRGNRFTTVAKDGLKRRGICIEPSILLGFQLFIGKFMKHRIHTNLGIDMLSAQQVHGSLARLGSLYGHLATIDLSDASDTICRELVRLVLPKRWYDLLSCLRSPATKVDGRWVVLSKFSSMGNGFTFELETIIYASLCLAVAELRKSKLLPGTNFGVFGDDIIVPTHLSQDILSVLRFSGMTPNTKKTFVSGHFRESCGSDFFAGVPVRGHNVEKAPAEPQDWFSLANGLRRIHSVVKSRAQWLTRARLRCLQELPSRLRRLRGPESLGDLVIQDDDGWSYTENKAGQAYIEVLQPYVAKLSLVHWKPSVLLASALYGIDSGGIAPRGDPTGYRIKRVALLERPARPSVS